MTAAFKTGLPQVQKFVLVALCDNANDQGECYPSVPMLAVKCSLTDRAIRKALVALEQSRHIVRSHRATSTNFCTCGSPVLNAAVMSEMLISERGRQTVVENLREH